MSGSLPAFITARRSIRRFTDDAVPRDTLETMVAAATRAPAPHHSRPWRFVVVVDDAAKRALAHGMGEAWRTDLRDDGVTPARIDELVESSYAKVETAPAVVLGCLTDDGLDRYPDERRQRAEHGMALLSLGAAVENLMLTAASLGYATCWVAAPIFCPEAARDALALDAEWLPHAMVLVGRPDPSYTPPAHPAPDLDTLTDWR